jgi:hypothetical protein
MPCRALQMLTAIRAGVPGPGNSGVDAGLDGGHQVAEDPLTGPFPDSPHTAAQQRSSGILGELAQPASLGSAYKSADRSHKHFYHRRAHELIGWCMPRGRQPARPYRPLVLLVSADAGRGVVNCSCHHAGAI